jgi:hypothetical protein
VLAQPRLGLGQLAGPPRVVAPARDRLLGQRDARAGSRRNSAIASPYSALARYASSMLDRAIRARPSSK